MTLTLRIVLIVACVIASAYTLRKIRKSQLNVDDAFFWIFFSLILLLLGIFPDIAVFCARLLGIEAPSNFVFMVMIFLVLFKLFSLAIEISVQKHRLNNLIQRLAIMNYEKKQEDIDLIKAEIIDFNEREASSEDK